MSRRERAEELVAIVVRAVDALDHMRTAEGARLAPYLEAAPGDHRAGRAAHRRAGPAAIGRAARSVAGGGAGDRRRVSRSTISVSRKKSRSSPTSSTCPRKSAASIRTSRAFRVDARVTAGRTASESGLGFLLQELLREANTTGSKANDAAIAARRDPHQGGARADPRAGGEPRVNPFPSILSRADAGRRSTIVPIIDSPRREATSLAICRSPKRRRLLGVVHDPRNRGRGERDGVDYHFLTRDEFLGGARAGDFAESAEVHGNLYGTLQEEIARVLALGRARHDGHRRPGRPADPGGLSGVRDDLRPAAVRRRCSWSASGTGKLNPPNSLSLD